MNAITMVRYDVMVRNLFKEMGTPAASLMHAAIGIAGEVAELSQACARNTDVVEECGDIEFYLCAYKMMLARQLPNIIDVVRKPYPAYFGTIANDLSVMAGELLDQTKKMWIYEKPIDADKITLAILTIESYLLGVYDLFGLVRADVQHANQIKLAKRYPDGVYTNQHAHARLDKVE